jgi:hypothetical protein
LPRQTKPTGKLETPLPHATPGTNFAWEGVTALDAESNYFLGSDPAKWRTHVKHFAAAEAKNVLPGVDILAYGNSEGMEYDLRVAPGADAQNLRLEIATAGAGQPPNMRVDTLGDLIVTFDGREMRMKKPAIYEEWAATESHPAQRKEISGGYDLEADGSVAFRVGKHDPRATLVLDPSLTVSYATFLGGRATTRRRASRSIRAATCTSVARRLWRLRFQKAALGSAPRAVPIFSSPRLIQQRWGGFACVSHVHRGQQRRIRRGACRRQ